MFFRYRAPELIRRFFPFACWSINTHKPVIYLTFDDGPNKGITDIVLHELNKYNAKATFFCVGENLLNEPELKEQILKEGHLIGNHTFHHLNGWKTNSIKYYKDFTESEKIFKTNYFRPPYGRITSKQAKEISKSHKIVMWDILSRDFDSKTSSENNLKNCIQLSKKGSIVVFHDSEKAAEKLKWILPSYLKTMSELGYSFETLP